MAMGSAPGDTSPPIGGQQQPQQQFNYSGQPFSGMQQQASGVIGGSIGAAPGAQGQLNAPTSQGVMGGGSIGGSVGSSQWGPGGAQANGGFQDPNGGFQGQIGGGYGQPSPAGLFDGGFGGNDAGFSGLGLGGSSQLGGAAGQDDGLFGTMDSFRSLGIDDADSGFGGGSQLWNDQPTQGFSGFGGGYQGGLGGEEWQPNTKPQGSGALGGDFFAGGDSSEQRRYQQF